MKNVPQCVASINFQFNASHSLSISFPSTLNANAPLKINDLAIDRSRIQFVIALTSERIRIEERENPKKEISRACIIIMIIELEGKQITNEIIVIQNK
jgi:hypothetical protein